MRAVMMALAVVGFGACAAETGTDAERVVVEDVESLAGGATCAPGACDDDDPCTEDRCAAQERGYICIHTAYDAAARRECVLTDGGAGLCNGTRCECGGATSCDDGDVCTRDVCTTWTSNPTCRHAELVGTFCDFDGGGTGWCNGPHECYCVDACLTADGACTAGICPALR
jgi:hypothetical protein